MRETREKVSKCKANSFETIKNIYRWRPINKQIWTRISCFFCIIIVIFSYFFVLFLAHSIRMKFQIKQSNLFDLYQFLRLLHFLNSIKFLNSFFSFWLEFFFYALQSLVYGFHYRKYFEMSRHQTGSNWYFVYTNGILCDWNDQHSQIQTRNERTNEQTNTHT